RARWRRPRPLPRRDRRAPRIQRIRQVDTHEGAHGLRADPLRIGARGRLRRHRAAARSAAPAAFADRPGVPAVQPRRAPQRADERAHGIPVRRGRTERLRHFPQRRSEAGARAARPRGHRTQGERAGPLALGRPAAARRDRAGTHAESARDPRRRARRIAGSEDEPHGARAAAADRPRGPDPRARQPARPAARARALRPDRRSAPRRDRRLRSHRRARRGHARPRLRPRGRGGGMSTSTLVHPKLDPRERERMERAFRVPRSRSIIGVVLAVAIFLWSANGAQFDFLKLGEGASNMGDFLLRMFPPDFSKIGLIMKLLLETLQMAIVGTVLGAVLALVVAFGAASNIAPSWLYYPCRWAMNIIRALPDLVIALMFVAAVGLGPLAGILAMTIGSIGSIGKIYAEAMEAVDRGPITAMESVGASKRQVIQYGILPQAMPM